MGLNADVRICLKEVEAQVQAKVFLKLAFTSSSSQFPQEIAEKTALDQISSFYAGIFEGLESTPKPKQSAPEDTQELHPWLKMIIAIAEKIPKDRQFILTLALCFVLIINSFTLLIIVKVLSRMQDSIIELRLLAARSS
jgi:hypothetical protein